jgi:hypothetical protein
LKSKAAKFISYYEYILTTQENEQAKAHWTLGLEAAQWWYRLEQQEIRSREEVDEFVAHLEKHINNHGSAWYDMWLQSRNMHRGG